MCKCTGRGEGDGREGKGREGKRREGKGREAKGAWTAKVSVALPKCVLLRLKGHVLFLSDQSFRRKLAVAAAAAAE